MSREIIIGVWFWGDLIIIKTDQEVCALSGEKSPMLEGAKQPSHFFRASQSSALPPHGQGVVDLHPGFTGAMASEQPVRHR